MRLGADEVGLQPVHAFCTVARHRPRVFPRGPGGPMLGGAASGGGMMNGGPMSGIDGASFNSMVGGMVA